ncbi:hypothetical protein [Sphingorhabdus sp.]|uniref:hypothetical protein n=1 Tax=Sphingorhabdus sp. TaxID=1902408 RepID=UPI0037C5B136
MTKGTHILVGCNNHFFGSAMLIVVPAPFAEYEWKVPACNAIIFWAKSKAGIRPGRATKKPATFPQQAFFSSHTEM